MSLRDFPGGPVVKTPSFQCKGMGLTLSQGTKTPHAMQYDQIFIWMSLKAMHLPTLFENKLTQSLTGYSLPGVWLWKDPCRNAFSGWQDFKLGDPVPHKLLF